LLTLLNGVGADCHRSRPTPATAMALRNLRTVGATRSCGSSWSLQSAFARAASSPREGVSGFGHQLVGLPPPRSRRGPPKFDSKPQMRWFVAIIESSWARRVPGRSTCRAVCSDAGRRASSCAPPRADAQARRPTRRKTHHVVRPGRARAPHTALPGPGGFRKPNVGKGLEDRRPYPCLKLIAEAITATKGGDLVGCELREAGTAPRASNLAGGPLVVGLDPGETSRPRRPSPARPGPGTVAGQRQRLRARAADAPVRMAVRIASIWLVSVHDLPLSAGCAAAGPLGPRSQSCSVWVRGAHRSPRAANLPGR